LKVAVTGAAGFIGSQLVAALLSRNHTVSGCDNFDPFYNRAAKERNLASVRDHPRFTFLESDVRDVEAMKTLVHDCECCFHLAAKAGVRPSFSALGEYADVNVVGTARLLEAAVYEGTPKFVFASSSSVYGEGAPAPFREGAELGAPLSPYASTKLAGEYLCRNFTDSFDSTIILRLFTVYGPRQRPDLAIHKFARMISEDEEIPVFGDIESARDYSYIDDIVDGICRSLEWRGNVGAFNLASGHPITLNEMIEALEQSLGKTARRRYLPPQRGDMQRTWADISNAHAELGYEPSTSFQEGIELFCNWFRSEYD
jgi:UDP-glucuronate 4-epimerase